VLGLKQWLPIAVAVRLVAIKSRLKGNDQPEVKRPPDRANGAGVRRPVARILGGEGIRVAALPLPALSNKVRDYEFCGSYRRQNLSGRRNRVQLIACTSIIDAVHTAAKALPRRKYDDLWSLGPLRINA
jgi:hypothetical protein